MIRNMVLANIARLSQSDTRCVVDYRGQKCTGVEQKVFLARARECDRTVRGDRFSSVSLTQPTSPAFHFWQLPAFPAIPENARSFSLPSSSPPSPTSNAASMHCSPAPQKPPCTSDLHHHEAFKSVVAGATAAATVPNRPRTLCSDSCFTSRCSCGSAWTWVKLTCCEQMEVPIVILHYHLFYQYDASA